MVGNTHNGLCKCKIVQDIERGILKSYRAIN